VTALLLVAACWGCAASQAGWDLAALEARYPAVAGVRGHALGHAIPSFALGADGLELLLCRWSVESPVPVWLPRDASPDARRAIEAGLDAWERAGLGIHFGRRTWSESPPRAGIVFELVEPDAERRGSGSTVADCAIPVEVGPDPADGPVDAELQYASIHLQRALRDALGRPVPVDPSELAGAAVHELGHALGFPGHEPGAGSLMSAHGQVDAARRTGRRVLVGEPLEAPTLSALYAAPSGARVGRLPLTDAQRAPLRAVSAMATRIGLRGPFVQVGQDSARLVWRDAEPSSVAVVVLAWRSVLRDPARFEARLNRRARLLVAGSGERGTER
jgi:hypothetical protein